MRILSGFTTKFLDKMKIKKKRRKIKKIEGNRNQNKNYKIMENSGVKQK